MAFVTIMVSSSNSSKTATRSKCPTFGSATATLGKSRGSMWSTRCISMVRFARRQMQRALRDRTGRTVRPLLLELTILPSQDMPHSTPSDCVSGNRCPSTSSTCSHSTEESITTHWRRGSAQSTLLAFSIPTIRLMLARS